MAKDQTPVRAGQLWIGNKNNRIVRVKSVDAAWNAVRYVHWESAEPEKGGVMFGNCRYSAFQSYYMFLHEDTNPEPIIRNHRHGLMAEGAAFTSYGDRIEYNTVSGVGYALCACGVISDVPLPSAASRRRWHRKHKSDIQNKKVA